MLRDLLCSLPGVGSWPCDEINYIWRHGNIQCSSDEFTRDMATPVVKAFITRQFDKLADKLDLDVVVEKTCANSVRMEFVDEIVHGARYVFIVRDGIDAAGSAAFRWRAKLDIPYLIRKARYVPLGDLPHYARRYLANRIYRVVSREKRLSAWGPQLNNMSELLSEHSLLKVCAIQWKACVEKAESFFDGMKPRQVVRVRYEDFVRNPGDEFGRIADFIQVDLSKDVLASVVARVTDTSIGKGRDALTEVEKREVVTVCGDVLRRHGYGV